MGKTIFRLFQLLSLLSISFALTACLSDTSYAPVYNALNQPEAKPKYYTVRKGDTVYSIAWTLGLDYRVLAAANGLRPPYPIHPGQQLSLRSAPQTKTYAQTKPSTPTFSYKQPSEKVLKVYHARAGQSVQAKKVQSQARTTWSNRPVSSWRWPARGRVIENFSPALAGNRGLDIAGWYGEPVRASAPGEVVYSGDGVRGYGNLLIIKHNDSYLSAYAFNKKLLVRLGERVQAGQKIAEMGRNNAGRVMLHFEIRKNGRPVNPKHYLRG